MKEVESGDDASTLNKRFDNVMKGLDIPLSLEQEWRNESDAENANFSAEGFNVKEITQQQLGVLRTEVLSL